jgi:hypothetical protein
MIKIDSGIKTYHNILLSVNIKKQYVVGIMGVERG